jgi:hypothetical protein
MEKDDVVPDEHANEESGSGGADSPEEVIGVDEEAVQSEKDVDEGPVPDQD